MGRFMSAPDVIVELTDGLAEVLNMRGDVCGSHIGCVSVLEECGIWRVGNNLACGFFFYRRWPPLGPYR